MSPELSEYILFYDEIKDGNLFTKPLPTNCSGTIIGGNGIGFSYQLIDGELSPPKHIKNNDPNRQHVTISKNEGLVVISIEDRDNIKGIMKKNGHTPK